MFGFFVERVEVGFWRIGYLFIFWHGFWRGLEMGGDGVLFQVFGACEIGIVIVGVVHVT